jgi:hypothetical protein
VMPSCVALVLAAPCGPVKAVVKGLRVVAGQVEQAADLADGQWDETVALARGRCLGLLVLIVPAGVVFTDGRQGLSTGCRSPF